MNREGFSWNKLLGISAAKGRLSREIGVPLARSERQRKLGVAVGYLIRLWVLVTIALVGSLAMAALSRRH
jgi:hypothetical protein